MRLDYILYGLGILFFGLSAVSFLIVAAPDGQLLYVIFTAVLGVISIGVGVAQRPTARTPVQPVTAPLTIESPVSGRVEQKPTPPVAVEAPLQASPAAEPAKEAAETTVEEAPAAPVSVEAPKVEAAPINEPKAEAPIVASVSEAPKTEAAVVEPPAIHANPETSESAPQSASAVATEAPAKPVFGQIRGINEKRAAQLNANGIATLEQLANASADELAAKLEVSPRIVKMWIGSAKKLAK
jgi:predicted flap endonuclease-1-like 5' DNA nuclease